jgi:CheY-like chemotaxis protein
MTNAPNILRQFAQFASKSFCSVNHQLAADPQMLGYAGSPPLPRKNSFAIFPFPIHVDCMTQPLALVFYEKLMPGSQLVNRLQDLNYLVRVVNDLASFQESARAEGPLLAIVDLAGGGAVCRAIAELKADAATQHIPIIAFAGEQATELQAAAQMAGATLVVGEAAIANYLPQLLNQALQV